MKTKLLLLLTLTLVSCDYSAIKSRQAVVEAFGTTEVLELPEQVRRFIVRGTDGSMWLVQTNGLNKIAAKTKLFEGRAGKWCGYGPDDGGCGIRGDGTDNVRDGDSKSLER